MDKKHVIFFILITPIFILLSNYFAIFPHEYAHSIAAWLFGYKEHPFDIDYGGTSWLNLLLLSNIDEKVNYEMLYELGKGHIAAVIAFSGPGIANGLKYIITLLLLNTRSVQKHLYLYYFIFWFNFMNIANFYAYVPVRVFSSHGDMGHIAHGLSISSWYIYIVFGYIVAFIMWYFFTRTLIQVFVNLKMNLLAQASLMILVVILMFGYFGMAGFMGYGEISHLLSATSFIMIPGIIVACWPTREWVQRRIIAYK